MIIVFTEVIHMKRVVSISLGSSSRDHRVFTSFLGEEFQIERIGTDGCILKAIDLIRKLEGKVDAFGMGGIDLHVHAGNKKYIIRDAERIKKAAGTTPMLDGSGLKNTLEREVIDYLQRNDIIDFTNKKVLITSAMDRFGMADAIASTGARMIIGDLMFALGVDIPLYSMKALQLIARYVAPIVCRLPFKMLYPTGDKQKENETTRLSKYYNESDIIAGDYHYIKRYMPEDMRGKTIITNTVTKEDVAHLKRSGVGLLITTTPELEGRSFGTNVMEAMLALILRSKGMAESEENYLHIIREIGLLPRIEYLNPTVKKTEGPLAN